MRNLLVMIAIAAATSAAGIVACRGREGGDSGGGAVVFKTGGHAGTSLQGIVAFQDRLWVSTELGIAVLDPVDETWTMLQLGSRDIRGARIVPCGSDLWLLQRDSIFIVDVKRKTVQPRREPPGFQSWDAANSASCGGGALWLYEMGDGSLFRLTAADTATERYGTRAPGRSQYIDYVEALENGVYLLSPQYRPGIPHDAGLFHFDRATKAIDRVPLPRDVPAITLERTDEGLVLRATDSSAFLLKAEGQPWTELPRHATLPGDEPLLVLSNGVMWVGASYDVSPASYFVLRYIRDAKEPNDLVVLPRWFRGGRAVQYLGMLWVLMPPKVLRIDPESGTLVSYELTDSTGKLRKRSFPLAKDSTGVLFFDGDTLRQFSESPVTAPEPEPESPDSSNSLKESER